MYNVPARLNYSTLTATLLNLSFYENIKQLCIHEYKLICHEINIYKLKGL